MKKRDKGQAETGGAWLGVLCGLTQGGALAGATALAVLLAGAALVAAGLLRERWMEGAVMAACVLGGLIGGLFAVRKIGRRTLLVGLGTGAILFLLLLTAGLLADRPAAPGENGAGVLCACLCGGGVAGILGGKPKKKRRR